MRRLMLAAVSAGVLSLAAASPGLGTTGKTNAKCGLGSVRGIAWVTGGAPGVGSLTGNWSSAASLFGYRWNCSGGAISVRKPDSQPPGFDVRFAGNPGRIAIVSSAGGPAAGAASRNADGSFHITLAGNPTGAGGFNIRQDLPFIVIVF
jgi:hypothetical protein